MPLLAVICTFVNITGLYLVTRSLLQEPSNSLHQSTSYSLYLLLVLLVIINTLILLNGIILFRANIPEKNWQIIASLMLSIISCLVYSALKIHTLENARKQFFY